MTISGLCTLAVIADKRATELSVFHALECDAMTRNVVKRLDNQNLVNCLFDIISQAIMLSFHGTEKNTCLGHRGLSGTKEQDVVQFRL